MNEEMSLPKMKICVSGWYFMPELMEQLAAIDYEVAIVTYHRRANGELKRDYDTRPIPEAIAELPQKLTHYKIPVAGLEWGGYDYYLKNIWDRSSNILFMHDDIAIYNVKVFDKIAMLECDQAFIFRDEEEERANGRIHGRGVFCSQRFLKFMLNYVCMCGQTFDHPHPHYPEDGVMLEGTGPHTGFWYDAYNLGEHTSGKVPHHCRHYNAGVYHFAAFAGRCARKDSGWPGFNSKVAVHFPEFNSARRGEWKGPVYGRGKELVNREGGK